MKTNMIRAALACAALVLSATPALADGVGIPSIPVGLDHDPEGLITHSTTDAGGNVVFAGLRPGRYAVVLTGRDLIAALDRYAANGGHRSACFDVLGRTVFVGVTAKYLTAPPVCGASAGRGIRIGFTVPASAGARDTATVEVRVTIADQRASGGRASR